MERIAMDFKSVISLKQLSCIMCKISFSVSKAKKYEFGKTGKKKTSKRICQKRTSIVKDGED